MQQNTLVFVPHITRSTALNQRIRRYGVQNNLQAEPAAQIAAFRLSALINVSMVDISTFRIGFGSCGASRDVLRGTTTSSKGSSSGSWETFLKNKEIIEK